MPQPGPRQGPGQVEEHSEKNRGGEQKNLLLLEPGATASPAGQRSRGLSLDDRPLKALEGWLFKALEGWP